MSTITPVLAIGAGRHPLDRLALPKGRSESRVISRPPPSFTRILLLAARMSDRRSSAITQISFTNRVP